MNIFRKWKEKKDKEADQLIIDLEKQMRDAEGYVFKSTLAMTSMQCPFMKMKSCTTDCIHFKKGTVFKMPMYGVSGYYVDYHPSKCRLWKD